MIKLNRSRRHRGQVVPHLGRRHHLGVAAEAEQDPGRGHPAEPQPHHGPLRVVPAGVPFGPVVEVSPDAAPYAQLAAWLGRHP